MTIPYNATWFSCFRKFLSALREDGIVYKDLSETRREEIKKMHHKFYNKISQAVKDEFYLGQKNSLKVFKYDK